jgi:anaerobic magnesium-protoporphyrin IX monomethyl ester cyclase
MKVALINPGRDQRWAGCEPLNIGYVASYLELHGHQVRIFDELVGDNVVDELEYYRPDIAGITAVTPLAQDAYRLVRHLKGRGIRTVMGGVHAKFLPDEALENGVDIVATGAGETAMLKIVTDGVERGVVDGPLPKNLDDFPKPSRHLFSDFYYQLPEFAAYNHFVPRGTRSARMITSRGCAYRCAFCHNSLGEKNVLFHSPERVVEEARELVEKYHCRHIFFMDDNFLMKRKRTSDLCEGLRLSGLDLSWALLTTANEVREEQLPMLRLAGAKQIAFGFESGSQRILDLLQKRTTVEKNEWALRKAYEAGLSTQVYILIGSPTETREDLERTKAFLQRNRRYITSALTSFVNPYPGNAIYEEMRKDGRLGDVSDIDWSALRFDTPNFPVNQVLSPKELRKYYFEMVATIPPDLRTVVARTLVDPVGVMANVMRTDKAVIAKIVFASLFKQWRRQFA